MKGGRTAPRSPLDAREAGRRTRIASMKGGRTAPRSLIAGISDDIQRRGFNEGGADCPPKPEMTAEAKCLTCGLQ